MSDAPDVDPNGPADVDRLARSMLALLGHDDDEHPTATREATGTWSKAPDFASDPERAAAVKEASARDRERYLTAGLTPVDCRFCHVAVAEGCLDEYSSAPAPGDG